MSAKAAAKPFLLTSIGKKYLMGVTGLIWSGFVLTHMIGNLLIFVGADAYNSYGHALTSGYLIYAAEALLVFALLSHVFMGIRLTIENRKARGDSRYAMTPNGSKGSSLASRTMAVQGSVILFFVISHLAGFKFGTHYETTVNGVVMRDLYRLILEVFKQPGFVFWYAVSLLCLGFHLSHGVGSIFQSFGLKNQRSAAMISKISIAYSIIVVLGFLSQPFYVYFIAG